MAQSCGYAALAAHDASRCRCTRGFSVLTISAQSRCNFCDVATLVACCFDFDSGRQPHAVSTDDRRSAVRAAALNLRNAELAFECIRKPNNHKAKVHEHNMKRNQRGFLSAMLACGSGEDRTDFADQLVL